MKVPWLKCQNVDVTVIRRLHVARVPNLDLLPVFVVSLNNSQTNGNQKKWLSFEWLILYKFSSQKYISRGKKPGYINMLSTIVVHCPKYIP